MEFPEHMVHSMPLTIYSIPSIHSIHSRVCPYHALCAMRSASQQTTQPCAFEPPRHMALTTPCAPSSVHIRTYPYLSVPALPPPCALRNALRQPHPHAAMRYKSTKTHGTQYALCPLSIMSIPLPAVSALRNVLRQPPPKTKAHDLAESHVPDRL